MRRLLNIWRRFWNWLFRRDLVLHVKHVTDTPEELDPQYVYVAGEGPYHWFAAFLCPCGCGEEVKLSLLTDSRPRWRVEEHRDGSVTLHPSIRRIRGCRSHFFIRHGRIVWCADDAIDSEA